MTREVHLSIPADRVERFSVHRFSVHTLKSYCQRQHGRLRPDRRGEKKPVEGKDGRAIAGRGFGEDLNGAAAAQRAAYAICATDAAARCAPIDKDRSAEY